MSTWPCTANNEHMAIFELKSDLTTNFHKNFFEMLCLDVFDAHSMPLIISVNSYYDRQNQDICMAMCHAAKDENSDLLAGNHNA